MVDVGYLRWIPSPDHIMIDTTNHHDDLELQSQMVIHIGTTGLLTVYSSMDK